MDCIFCKEFDKDRIVHETDTWIAVLDSYPVSEGHTLLIPRRHCEDYFGLEENETLGLNSAIRKVVAILDERYHPDGYNIGANCGESAGQTVMHCHIHVIPRYSGDVKDPRGGVRGVIPDKQKY